METTREDISTQSQGSKWKRLLPFTQTSVNGMGEIVTKVSGSKVTEGIVIALVTSAITMVASAVVVLPALQEKINSIAVDVREIRNEVRDSRKYTDDEMREMRREINEVRRGRINN